MLVFLFSAGCKKTENVTSDTKAVLVKPETKTLTDSLKKDTQPKDTLLRRTSSLSATISYNYPSSITIAWASASDQFTYNVDVSISGTTSHYRNIIGSGLTISYPLRSGLTISATVVGAEGTANLSTTVGGEGGNNDVEVIMPNIFNYSCFFEPNNRLKVNLRWSKGNDVDEKLYFYLYYRSEDGLYSSSTFSDCMIYDENKTLEIIGPYFNGTRNFVRLIVSTRVLNDGNGYLRNINNFPVDYNFYIPYQYYTDSFQISTPFRTNPYN